ncbi:MAG: TolC family protein [Campylobacterota bacterium]|nr:TolC family protein [Campylobacterota bacterium]
MSRLLLLVIPFFLHAESLKSILEFATQNSDLVISKKYTQESKSKYVQAREGAYYPTLDLGAFYQTLQEKTPMLAGDTYSGYATLAYDIYDGGKRSALLDKSINEHKASSYDTKSIQNSISLKIVELFFNIKSLEDTLDARDEAKKSLDEQLTRMKRFVLAKVATKDDVDRLQAAYDTNIYEMESIKLEILTLKKLLELNVGKQIGILDNSKFIEFKEHELELIDSVLSIQANKDALIRGAESIESVYYPHVRVEDSYSLYGYNRTDAQHPEGLDNQNRLMLTLNMRVFDKGIAVKNKEALLIEAQALNTQLSYSKKEQKMQFDLSLSRIKTAFIKIKSASSALVSADSAFEIINKKYDAGIVDNVVYLDALSSQTTAKALYKKSLNDLEIAYATYYYYAGKNLKEFLL